MDISEDAQEPVSDMDDDDNSEDLCSADCDSESKRERPIRLWNQAKLNDILRNFGLDKDVAEYLASELKHDSDRDKEFLPFCRKEDSCVLYRCQRSYQQF